ncbi:MAG TPA: L-threonylcarbamoyladenylate synthase [Cyclobacteriaceae bacterium]|nr:L-threonylcarbamoyladenylate synthase [Cyclobacteriaceae bacterium]
MAEIGINIEKASQLLMQNELVAIPTETVYGLAGNALNKNAVTKIFKVKDRPEFDPLIVHVADLIQAKDFVTDIPEQAQQLADEFWPGPLTLVLKKKKIIPDLVTAGLDTVGIRCPDHSLTQQLLRKLSFPLAAPSANPFGYVSPTKPEHVEEQLGGKIQYILDGGSCSVGIESTIVGFEDDTPVVYRLGGLSLEKIESTIGKVKSMTHSMSNPKAPGQLKSHYAPRKKVFLGAIEELLQSYPAHESGILTFQKDFNSPFQYILSPSGNLEEAAQNIFEALRSFDKMPVDVILAEPVPNTGLGRAINDRLQRAAVL